MKTLRSKMLVFLLIPALVLIVISLVVSSNTARNIVTNTVQETALATTQQAAERISEFLNGLVIQVKTLAETNAVKNALTTNNAEDTMVLDIAKRLEHYDFVETAFIAYPDGTSQNTLGTTANISDRDYFIKIIREGYGYTISNPVISKATGKPVFVVAAPVKDERGTTIGLFGITVLVDYLDKFVSEVTLGKTGYAWLIDSQSTVIAHPNKDYILNFKLNEATSKGFKGLEQIIQKMLAGETGFGKIVTPEGTKSLVFYAPIKSAKGWGFGITITEKELYEKVSKIVLATVINYVVLLAAVSVVVFIMSTKISKPLVEISEKVVKFGEGDLTLTFEPKGNDEIAYISKALRIMSERLTQVIKSITENAQHVTASSEELASTSVELSQIADELAHQMEEIDHSVQNVSASVQETTSGIEEVASSAQNVSRAAQELAERATMVSNAAKEGENAVKVITTVITQAREKSAVTDKIVRELSDRAKNIGEIVETINSIAEQTNLLALNAAIEAARAGEAGRGFAVVADEIRKLAEESKQATTKIAQILKQIQEGAEQASSATDETVEVVVRAAEESEVVSEKLSNILKQVEVITDHIESLAASAQEQSAATQEMTSAMDTITKSIMSIAQQVDEITNSVKHQTDAIQGLSGMAQELATISNNLLEQVRKFKV
ncbi:methyl-accepting chemotaxis protein [Fervidobacterium pennivorans subsp. carthaginiensis]|uniref:methyl-accepting chemotaxis protein n=1 Tax=Fervidobacterium pennivorans TaxID=93466 RepID=UPI00355C5B66